MMNGWLRVLALLAVVPALLLSAADARAIEIETVVWGFDGKAVPNQFNPLSVLVFNPTAEPFDGRLELKKSVYDEMKGATLVEPVFVSPFTRRWVQFYPFIQHDQEKWHLTWQPGFGRDVQGRQPTIGEPAHVLLDAADSLSRGGNLRRFNEELFPPLVSATAGLASVTVDHDPSRWEKPRQDAFLDWIYAGGEVHVLQDETGKHPVFSGALSELNSPLETFRIGAGVVHRHARNRNQLDKAFVAEQIRHADPNAAATPPAEEQQKTDAAANDPYGNGVDYTLQSIFSEVNQGFLRSLKGMTRPDHNWIVIHLMSIAYILLVFPGCWLIGREWRDYRITLGALLAAIFLFSVGFQMVGRRGYGEATAVHSIAIARPLAEGRYDVMQFSNLFVTSGDDYVIGLPGEGGLYSTAQENERVKGIIKNGAGAYFQVDIPPYSSREFVSRFQATSQPISLVVNTWTKNAEHVNLTLTAGGNFPATTEEIFAVYQQQVYRVNRNGSQLTLGSSRGNLKQFLTSSKFAENSNNNYMWGGEPPPVEQVFRGMLEPLMARQLGINTVKDVEAFSLSDDRVRLFVLAPLPEEFGVVRDIDGNRQTFGRQEGRILYCFDLFDPKET